MFPIGGMTKAQVRQKAKEAGLLVAEKPESQDICFVPDGNAAGLMHRHGRRHCSLGILLMLKARYGQHTGVAQFTVGQRKGLGLDRATLKGQRRFVLELVPSEARVVIGIRRAGAGDSIAGERCNWFCLFKLGSSA